MHFGLVALIGILATGNGKAISKDALAGTWRAEEMGAVCTETYSKDGAFKGECSMGGQNGWKYAGTWTLEGDVLVTTYTESTMPGVPKGKVDRDRVEQVNGTELVVVSSEGAKVSYKRVGAASIPAPKAK